jgi:TRAP-type C4-dicarboxylate transport system substrate-binding protein
MVYMNNAIYASITPEYRAQAIIGALNNEAHLKGIGAYTAERKDELLAQCIAKEIHCAVNAAVAADRLK